jgi:hypothetical protein
MSYFTERAKQLGVDLPEAGERKAGESYFQQRARELGLNLDVGQQAAAAPAPTNNFFTNRAMDLGIVPDVRHDAYHNAIDTTNLTLPSKGLAPFDANMVKPGATLEQQKLGIVNSSVLPKNPFEQQKPASSSLLRSNPNVRAVDAHVEHNPIKAGWEQIQQGMQTAVNFQQQPTSQVPSTGNKTVDGFLRGAGSFLPGLASGQTEGEAVGAISKGAQSLGAKLLPKSPRLTNVFGHAVEAGIENARVGAASGQTDTRQVAENAAIGGGLGAVGDVVARGVGSAFKKLASSGTGKGKSIQALKDALNELGDVATGGQNQGIAFGKKAGPYDNLRTDTKSQLVTKLKRDKGGATGLSDRMYTALVDDVHQFNKFDKAAESATGESLNPSDSVHKTALASRGGDVQASQIIHENLIDSKGKVIGASLKDRLAAIPKGKYVDFEDYLINRHAITRYDRGEKVFRDDLNWTPDVGKAKLAAYDARHPEFKAAADDIYNFQNEMLQKWLVEPGIITKEQAKAYQDANPFYVPMKRQFSKLEKTGKGLNTKKGFGDQSNPNKSYSPGGSDRPIISPIESMIENVDSYVKAAKRNKVMQAFVKQLQKAPDALKGFAEIVQQPGKLDNIKGIDLSSEDGLDEMFARMSDDFDKVMRKTKLDKDNIVRVMINGEPVHVKINDKHLLEAVTAIGPENGSKLLDAVGWLTNKMKVLTTGANPMFSLTRNLLRDIPQAYIASKSTGNPIRFTSDLFDAAWSIARNKELYQEFKNMGGGHSSSVAADRNLLAQSKRSVVPGKKLNGLVPKAISKLENVLNAVESAPRLAEYKRYAKLGQRERGLFESQDVTVNFKRRGKLTRELDKVFPYFNAAVQGMDKFARMYKDNPIKAATKSFVAVTIPTLAAYAWNYDNPDYQKLDNRTKDNFILIPKGDGTFYKIAKPKEIGTVFSDIPERLLRQFHDQDPEAFKGFAEQLRTTFTIPGMQGLMKTGSVTDRLSGALGDTILGPVADIGANKNFADSPIVPGYLQHLSPELQYDAKTSSLSKKLGGLTKTSPKQLDYLIKQYTGVLGQVGLPMMNPGSGNTPLQSLGNSFMSQISADPVYSNEIMNKFYDNKSKFDQANTDSSVTGVLPKWYVDSTRILLGQYNTRISDVRKSMRGIENDPKIDADAKRQKLRMMQDEMNKLAEEANKIVGSGIK